MDEVPAELAPVRSYGCEYGCGNAYDIILLQPLDSTTMYLCFPHFFQTAADVYAAFIGDADDDIKEMMGELSSLVTTDVQGSKPRRGRHNAPVGTDNQDAIDAFDGVVYEDELDERFQPSAE
jgi:hypothetical protein